jgi:hypothetical protein
MARLRHVIWARTLAELVPVSKVEKGRSLVDIAVPCS